MVREIGISLFLACVGISAGDGFVDTIVNNGGFAWIGYGFIITFCAADDHWLYRPLFLQGQLLTLMGSLPVVRLIRLHWPIPRT